jgi:hypothetical protein
MNAMRAMREALAGGARGRFIALLVCLSASAFLTSAVAAEGPSRAEYVVRLERICKPGSEATQRAVHGVRADVRSERFRSAATKFAAAKRIFARTVRAISVVPRPPADEKTLTRWFAHLGHEKVYLGQIAAALRASHLPRFQHLLTEFVHEGNQANNAVISFGFTYCLAKPSRFQ